MSYGLYLHIPYCKCRCTYCDFYTAATPGGQVPNAYLRALLRDFAVQAPRGADGGAARPSSVYFGGGTPSLLAPAQVQALLHAVAPLPAAEITMEANPESATLEKLHGWRAAGVNRLSLGVQSANDATLRTLGRLHTAAQARLALQNAAAAGFENISGDMMLGLPGTGTADIDATIALLREGSVSHISAYLLKLEPGTPLAAAPPPNLPGADAAADEYLYAASRLQAAGYPRYEISNFARPGFESRHNLLYWRLGEWLGLGPAAHSHLAGRRFSCPASTKAFLAGGTMPVIEGTTDAGDWLMMGLRLAEGIDEGEMRRRFGHALSRRQTALMERFLAAGYAQRTPGGWALTGRGMLVQNALLTELLD